MNSVKMDMRVHMSLRDLDFDSFGWIPKSGIDGSFVVLFFFFFFFGHEEPCMPLWWYRVAGFHSDCDFKAAGFQERE